MLNPDFWLVKSQLTYEHSRGPRAQREEAPGGLPWGDRGGAVLLGMGHGQYIFNN